MAENRNIEVGGRLHSIATGNVLAGANEIFDDDKNKKQSEINTETYSLVNDVNERLSGLSPDQQSALNVAAKATNNETKLGYYVCGTDDNVATKVISDATGYILSKGGSIKIKMTNANTANNVTLNINSTGAKALYYDGERASANNSWDAGETVEVYYDGTSFYANSVAGGSGSGDGVFNVSVKYPTSGVEGGNTYTLDGALTVLNANLSASKKKGGMSIKFIQSSDNKYVQYRLTKDSWSIDTEDWAIADEGVYVEDPEYVYVKTDAEGKILLAIKVDGSIYYGAGVPQQVKDYIEEKISSLPLDEYEDIVAFIGGLLSGDKTLQELLDNKLDAVIIDNPEYIQITTDNEDKVLEGIKADGSKIIEGNVVIGGNIFTKSINVEGNLSANSDNPEYIKVTIDSKSKILQGIKSDCTTVIGGDLEVNGQIINLSIQQQIDSAVESMQQTITDNFSNIDHIVDNPDNTQVDGYLSEQSNPDWIQVTTDSEGRVLGGRKKDGTVVENVKAVFNGGIECQAYTVPTKDSKDLITSGAVYDATVNKSVALTNNTVFNSLVKEVCGLRKETITSFAVIYARQTGNNYYNALYAYTTEGNFSVFQDVYRTQQECIDNNYGVKWNTDLNIGCVIDYRTLDVNKGIVFENLEINIPLELPYMPTLHNYHANEVMMKDKSFFKTLFDTAICIGDSVTEGNIDDYPNHVGVVSKYSYPSVLAKLTGWEVENAGESGITTKQWWDGSSQTHQAYFSKYDFQDYEIAFNALGNNGDLTDTLSEDTFDGEVWAPNTAYSVGKVVLYNKLGKKCIEAHTSSDTFDETKWTNAYLDYEDTQTGCYCKIIEGMLVQNPKIIIVLVIGSNFDITKQTVVKGIGERYGLPVVDCTESSYIRLAAHKYHGFHNRSQQEQGIYVGSHFNAVGYAAMASFIIGQFFKYLDDNTNIVRSSLNYNI